MLHEELGGQFERDRLPIDPILLSCTVRRVGLEAKDYMVDGHSLIDPRSLIEVKDFIYGDRRFALRNIAESTAVADYLQPLWQPEELVHAQAVQSVALSSRVAAGASVSVHHRLGDEDATVRWRVVDLVRVAIVALANVERRVLIGLEVEVGVDLVLAIREVELHR